MRHEICEPIRITWVGVADGNSHSSEYGNNQQGLHFVVVLFSTKKCNVKMPAGDFVLVFYRSKIQLNNTNVRPINR
jgi:hypothetical protein